MRLSQLKPAAGARQRRRRRGRGESAGQGRSCGRGQKGQHARDTVRPGFEGGQMPLFRRLPKVRGNTNKAMNIGRFRKSYAVINVGQLAALEVDEPITPELLHSRKIVKDLKAGLKILATGDLNRPLQVQAHACSEAARQKIEAAGGTLELI